MLMLTLSIKECKLLVYVTQFYFTLTQVKYIYQLITNNLYKYKDNIQVFIRQNNV